MAACNPGRQDAIHLGEEGCIRLGGEHRIPPEEDRHSLLHMKEGPDCIRQMGVDCNHGYLGEDRLAVKRQ